MDFYLEPSNELEITEKNKKRVLMLLEKEFFKKGKFAEAHKGWTLLLNVSPSKRIKKNVKILGPSRVRSTKYIVYTLSLPAKLIIESSNEDEAFLFFIRQGLIDILARDFI